MSAPLVGKQTFGSFLDEEYDQSHDDDLRHDGTGHRFQILAAKAQGQSPEDGATDVANAAQNHDQEGIDDIALPHFRADIGNLREDGSADSSDPGSEGKSHGID